MHGLPVCLRELTAEEASAVESLARARTASARRLDSIVYVAVKNFSRAAWMGDGATHSASASSRLRQRLMIRALADPAPSAPGTNNSQRR